jgi:hypothetical protein
MDIATIIGLISGTVLIVGSIAVGGSLLTFINVPSLLVVLGGTVAVTFIRFKMADVIGSIGVALKAFLFKLQNPEEIITEMVEYTRIAKKEGLIALEKETPTDPFSAKALRYLRWLRRRADRGYAQQGHPTDDPTPRHRSRGLQKCRRRSPRIRNDRNADRSGPNALFDERSGQHRPIDGRGAADYPIWRSGGELDLYPHRRQTQSEQ